MEQIVVDDVNDKQNGWFDVVLKDGRTLGTNKRKLADSAYASRGNPVLAEIGSKPNGKFTNYYLNKLEVLGGAQDGATVAAETPPKLVTDDSITLPTYSDKQAIISAQWAIGRAVELEVAGSLAGTTIEDKAREFLALSRALAAE